LKLQAVIHYYNNRLCVTFVYKQLTDIGF